MGEEVKRGQAHDGQQVADQGDAQCDGNAEAGRYAVQLRLAIEIRVLAGVDDIETADPEEDGEAQDERNLETLELSNGDPRRQGSEEQ